MADDLVLVTGASGAVGPTVVRACLDAGHRVRTLSMDAPNDHFPPGVETRVGDICDRETVASAVAGARVVVHLAALLHHFKHEAGLDRRYERVNVGGTENVVRAAVALDVRRLVFLSTIVVYGHSHGRLLDETTAPVPDTTYGQTKLTAERLVLSARAGGEPIGTVLRSAAVYGARVKGNYRRLAEAIATRRFVPLGRCRNRRTLVHDSDLARAVLLASEHPAAAGGVFNVTDGCIHRLADIIAAIYRAVGRRPPRVYVPLGPVRAAVAVCEGACRAAGVQAPISRHLLEKYTEDVAVDGSLVGRVLGFRPLVDLEAGWQRTMASLRESGWH
jgi:nucleoside-diphosphate-sugar epimerase